MAKFEPVCYNCLGESCEIYETCDSAFKLKKRLADLSEKLRECNAIRCVDCGTIDKSNPYRVWCPKGMGERTRQDVCVLEGGS